MKIAIDIRSITNENRGRGIGIYTLNLLEALAEADQDNSYLLIAHTDKLSIKLPKKRHFKIVKGYRHPIVDRLMNQLITMPRLGRDDWEIFLQPDLTYGLPRSKKTVGVVYDFIELDYPAPKSRGVKSRFGDWLRNRQIVRKFKTMLQANALIAISNYTKQELIKRFPGTASTLTVAIPLGVKPEYRQSGVQPKEIPNKPFFLYVGGGDSRKNIPTLIEAYNDFRQRQEVALVLVGSDFINQAIKQQAATRQLIEASPYASDIILTGFLPEPEVIWLYQHALALTFPSLAEGFGLELLEAMAAGCPVICYNRTALAEVGRGAAIMVEDQSQLRDAMISISTNRQRRVELIKLGKSRAAEFNWTRTANETLKFLSEVDDEKNSG